MKFLKMPLRYTIAFVIAAAFSFSSCKKNSDSSSSASRNIKYELTGTYSGALSVNYVNADGVQQGVNITSLPWSIEVTIKETDFVFISFGAQTGVAGPYGQLGQTLTGKIYQGGSLKKDATVNATSSGGSDALIMLSTMGFNL